MSLSPKDSLRKDLALVFIFIIITVFPMPSVFVVPSRKGLRAVCVHVCVHTCMCACEYVHVCRVHVCAVFTLKHTDFITDCICLCMCMCVVCKI